MRRPFVDQGKCSRRGVCRYQRIKFKSEQKHAWLVMKYQFSCDVEYRVRRERIYREYFRMKLSSRAVEEVFQFHRPFRGKAAFKMSAYRPKNVLMETALEDVVTDV